MLDHCHQGGRVDRVSLVEGDRPRGLVLVSAADDSFGVRNSRAVVKEKVDVVSGGEQRADVSLENEVRLHGALDRLCHVWIGCVDQVAQLPTQLLLPGR